MKDLPTIIVRGYDVDTSWVSLVKSALTETYSQPASLAESTVIKIQGRVDGPEFVVTLKPRARNSNEELFTVGTDPQAPEGVVLLVPEGPLDLTHGRAHWMRNQIYANIVEWIKRSPRRNERDMRKSISPSPIPAEHSDPDFAIYFHPDLSQEQIDKSFSAIADFYRACGGTGFKVQREEKNASLPDVTSEGRA